MIKLLLDMKAAVEQAQTDGRTSLHPLEVADWKARYRALLQDGYQANPPDPPPQVSRRGRRTQSLARNLLDRLSTHQEAVLAFLDISPCLSTIARLNAIFAWSRVQQKILGSFRSGAGVQTFCRIHGYLSTLRKQGVPLLSALQQALVDHPVFPAF